MTANGTDGPGWFAQYIIQEQEEPFSTEAEQFKLLLTMDACRSQDELETIRGIPFLKIGASVKEQRNETYETE